MKALSIREPWTWAILRAGKRVENRTWHTNFRGRILLHASSHFRFPDYSECVESIVFALSQMEAMRGNVEAARWRVNAIKHWSDIWPVGFDQIKKIELLNLHFGSIVGFADIVDCRQNVNSVWSIKSEHVYQIVLSNVHEYLTPIPVRGAQGLFDVDDELVQGAPSRPVFA